MIKVIEVVVGTDAALGSRSSWCYQRYSVAVVARIGIPTY